MIAQSRILLLIILMLTGFSLFAQNYQLSGVVKDHSTGKGLPGATVQLAGTNTGTSTDAEGKFEIKGIKTKKADFLIHYVGFEQKNLSVDFGSDELKWIEVSLKEVASTLEQIEVVGKTEGQQKALLEQQASLNIKNIVSAEQIRQFPDMNAAEVVQRIPGITIQRDQGEGRFVQLRGTSPEFTNFSINGEQIPSPEGGVRYVGLDVISADQIDRIEVTKVLTPDMDADGIAGNVNIKTKSAADSIPEMMISAAGGYNQLMKTNNYQLQFTFGQRYKNVGFQVNANHYTNDQGSHNMEFDYTRGPLTSQSQDSTAVDNFYILYKDIELRHYTITRKRTGLSASLDYKPNKRHNVYLRAMYNRFSDDEQRRRIKYDFSDANDLLTYREAGIDHELKDRVKIQEISSLNIGAEHTLKNSMKIDYEMSWSLATEKQPDRMTTVFGNGGITMRVDKSNENYPRIRYPFEIDSLDAFNLNNYEFDELLLINSMVRDQNYTAKINFELPYNTSSGQKRYFKFGAKWRSKTKTREDNAVAYNKYFEKLSIYSQIGPPLDLTTIMDDFAETNLLGQSYLLDYIPGAEQMRNFFEKHPQHFKIDETDTWSKTYSKDYNAKEDFYAVYMMFRHDIQRLSIIGGLRYEHTLVNNQGVKAGVIYQGNGMLYYDSIFDKRQQNFLLPQLQLRYALDERTNVRAAATYSYTRPNFDDIIPYREDEDDEVEIGNPALKYPLALNLDVLAERYLPNKGLLSGGLFFKNIDNIAFNFVRNAHEGNDFNRYGLKKIMMAVNGLDAKVFGAEVQTQFKFNWFNNFLRNFGFYGNYTFTTSEARISKRYPQNENDQVFIFNEDDANFFTNSNETEIIPLPGQATHTANAALFFETKKWYSKLSLNYHSPFLYELGNDSGLDVFNDKALHLDLNTNYQISKSLNIFIDLINITNEPLKYYMGSREYFKKQEYYSWWGHIGVKWQL